MPALRNTGNTAANREAAPPHDITNPCRGRFYIGPGGPRRRKHPGRIWNPPLRPAAGMQPTGKPRPHDITNPCRGRCSHRPGELAAAQGFAGGPWPSPTNRGKRPAKRGGHDLPGKRRAGCPHPAGPCGGTNAPVLNLPRCAGNMAAKFFPNSHFLRFSLDLSCRLKIH